MGHPRPVQRRVPARARSARLHPERLADLGRADGRLRHQVRHHATATRTTASNKNLTGSPDYGARIVYVGDPGSGCSDNQYAQFNTAAVTGPTYGSVGMESGRNLLANCADKTVDLSLSRNIRVGGGRRLQFRRMCSTRSTWRSSTTVRTQIQYNSPTDLNVRNSQFNADGSVVARSPEAEERRFRRSHRRAEHAEHRSCRSASSSKRG